MSSDKRILVTGITGKVGDAFLQRFLESPEHQAFNIRALCHNRTPKAHERLEVVRGSVADRDIVVEAMKGVTHVLHMATCKEVPELIMDVTVKGMFWLLEACRESSTFQQFVMVGGDAGIGHFFFPKPRPVTETEPYGAYPGCYALSKVLEEVMLEQYYIQYDLNGCCLRAPWIMEKDDFKYQLSFGKDVFGRPAWHELVGPKRAAEYERTHTTPVMADANGTPIKRNFVHVEDLVNAILRSIDHPKTRQQTFHVCMDEPIDYGDVAAYLAESRGFPSVKLKTPYHSTWLDNTKAKFLLGWRPKYDMKKMVDAAWDYQRAADDPRVIWYPS